MARFAYVAVDDQGRERSGALEAESEAAARDILVRKRLMPVRVATATQAHAASETAHAQRPEPPVKGARLNNRALCLFVRQLATLTDAAIPLDEALGLIAAQQEKPSARRIITDVQEGVVEGLRLAQAMARHPQSFPGIVRAAVAGGERAGALGPVLLRLADHLARTDALRTKALTALIYPAALSVVAVLVIGALMIFVVPSLSEQFRAFEAQLPLVTRVLIGVSSFLSTFWPFVLIGAMGLAVFMRTALAQPHIALAADRALLRAPLIGHWVRILNASRLARSIATLTASGLPVLDSVRAARESVRNRHVAAQIAKMAAWIEEGEPLSGALRRADIAPPIVTYMAASGESAGKLPGMLEKAADHLDQDFEAASTTAVNLFEPALILIMGAIVACIVLAIMLPILQINQMAIG